jgi:hypothetical protein
MGSRGFLADDLLSARLTDLPDGASAASLRAWLIRDGLSLASAAAFLPLLIAIPAAWLLYRSRTGAAFRAAIAIALGPVAVALAFSVARLRWWNALDVSLVALLAATVAALNTTQRPRLVRWAGVILIGAILAPGLSQLIPRAAGGTREFRFTQAEVEGLYERKLSHWIADHAGPESATVLAPPYRTSSLCFYGSLRGLGTQNWENGEGLDATFHIVTAMTQAEARAVLDQRGVTHLVLPSWDSDLDDFARLRLKNPDDSFVSVLHRTYGGIFAWLRPLPFRPSPALRTVRSSSWR